MTMTRDAETTVRQMMEAFLAGDPEAFMSCLDDDIEWNPAEHHPFFTQQYRGKQQVTEALAQIPEVLDGFRFDVQRVLGCGETAVAQLRYQGTVKSTGRSLDLPVAVVFDVRDAKVIGLQEYFDSWAFMYAWETGR